MLFKTEDYSVLLTDDIVFKVCFFELVYLLSIVIGYTIVLPDNNNQCTYLFKYNYLVILILFLAGMYSRYDTFLKVSDISDLFLRSGVAYSEIRSGSQYIQTLSCLIPISTVIYMEYLFKRKKNLLPAVLMLVVGMASYLVFTQRSPAFEVLMVFIFTYHYMISPISIKRVLSIKYIIPILVCLLIIIIIPYLRTNSSMEDFDYKPFYLSIIDEFSMVGRDAFIYNYTNYTTTWGGRVYLNLFTGFIPSSIYLNKPPVDDGIYVFNLMNNFYVTPDMGRIDLPTMDSSIPFSSPGALYINFMVIGLVFGGLLYGVLIKLFYKNAIRTKCPIDIFYYQLVIYQLEFSTLSIYQTLIPFFYLFITKFLFYKKQQSI